MRYLSVCSGIEAASAAWEPLGWYPLAFAEVAPFPSRVLAARFPGVRNLGDLEAFRDWPALAPDVLVGGTPCQAFSVAGLRQGLDDPRGNLALTYLGVVDRYRPRWVVWENVPGVLHSNRGRDFGAFLGGLAQLGYGFAYRVLDAQHVRVDGYPRAVPQRRRRVFVVGHLGGWRGAAEVLLEPDGVRGDLAPRRASRTGVAPTLAARTRSGGGLGSDFDFGGGLIVSAFDPTQITHPESRARCDAPTSHALAATARPPVIFGGVRVRRLTPLECERLQGFPDGWTDLEGASPTARYRALGNSMAVNVMRWIGRRIEKARTE